jgi:hypothetical protein
VATYDTTALLAEIRRRAAAPVSSSSAPGFQDADLLAFANGIIPGIQDKLRRVRTNYFATQKDVPFVSGTASYRIPTRAQHGVVSLAQRLTSTGEIKHLTKWTERDMDGRNPTTAGTPTNYLWRSNSLVLWPVPDNSAESLRFTYHRRVNKLVLPSVCGVVTGSLVNVSNQATITVGVNYSTLSITTSTPVDVIQANAPFDSLVDDVTPIQIASNAALFAAGAVSTLPAVGDYVCLAGQAPVIQMPEQAFYVVAQAVACALLSEDAAALPAATRVLAMLEADLYGGANDRDDGEPDAAANESFF